MSTTQIERKAQANVQLLQHSAKWLAILAAIFLGCLYLGWLWWSLGNDPGFIQVLQQHLLALIGLPGCVIVAFVLVVVLEQVSGPIEFEALRFKFKGTSGQIAMWLAVFFSLVAALKALW